MEERTCSREEGQGRKVESKGGFSIPNRLGLLAELPLSFGAAETMVACITLLRGKVIFTDQCLFATGMMMYQKFTYVYQRKGLARKPSENTDLFKLANFLFCG